MNSEQWPHEQGGKRLAHCSAEDGFHNPSLLGSKFTRIEVESDLLASLNLIGSMYDGIFTHSWLICMVNVGKYTIHGSYGNDSTKLISK